MPTSAFIERLFTKLSRTKTEYRNRMLEMNLTTHGQIKLDSLNFDQPEMPVLTEKELEEALSWDFDDMVIL